MQIKVHFIAENLHNSKNKPNQYGGLVRKQTADNLFRIRCCPCDGA